MLFNVQKCQVIYNYPVRYFAPPKKGGNEKKEEKKAQEKAKVHEEFEGKELDDIKKEYAQSLIGCMDLLEEALDSIKSGRASTKIFDEVEVKAYGEVQQFCDVA